MTSGAWPTEPEPAAVKRWYRRSGTHVTAFLAALSAAGAPWWALIPAGLAAIALELWLNPSAKT